MPGAAFLRLAHTVRAEELEAMSFLEQWIGILLFVIGLGVLLLANELKRRH
jgi:hypothetical protein